MLKSAHIWLGKWRQSWVIGKIDFFQFFLIKLITNLAFYIQKHFIFMFQFFE